MNSAATPVKQISVLVAQSLELNRIGVKTALNRDDELNVVALVADPQECLKVAKEIQPDVIVSSMDFRNGNPIEGLELAKTIRVELPATKMVFLSDDATEDHILAGFAAGANGYFSRRAGLDQLVAGVKAAAAGTYSLCPRVAAVVLVAEATAAAQDNGADARLKRPFGLTKRELEVLALLITGCTNSQMARQLFVSEETIKTHMRHIMEKLMVSDRTEAAVKAVRLGLAQNPVSDLDALPSTRMSDGTE